MQPVLFLHGSPITLFCLSSLSSYGAYIRPVPYPNEIGLRMLIGGAAREAAMLGFHIKPVFSYYAYHGPIYRAMVQLCHGKEDDTR
jgi:tRNA (guanine26-N2/guanine27-N2)-dimethyltransferase